MNVRPILLEQSEFELQFIIPMTLNLKNFLFLVEGQIFVVRHLFYQMQWFFDTLQYAGLTIQQSIFPVIRRGIEQKVRPLPEC
jgi:hypothetical protein